MSENMWITTPNVLIEKIDQGMVRSGTILPVEYDLLIGGFCQKPTSNLSRIAYSMLVYAGNVGRREKM